GGGVPPPPPRPGAAGGPARRGAAPPNEALPQPQGGPGAAARQPRAGPPRLLAEHPGPVTCLAWSADGRRLAAGTQDGTVHVTEAATGKVLSFPTQGSAVTALAFSPDGQALALFNQLRRPTPR